ncbi:GDP-mannose mannosyl hydrolase [Simiduia agarivorans]|uniref:NUDIX hydrolase n=1 Tax=Simiduia agarivorans (strain DSM 21679 / JCM 13881 / BCRC 17597 / SA1) TaxID=1117647 RepID=K4KV05_SIMAS|nr:GDP-mannose mannosyl hydrolase [Simiduia agarivorans]AFU97752.1 NUDIX hydrolase [Simiduia agarivorans SA1 = DSM 21679]
MFLDKDTFSVVVDSTPLVSIDFIIEDGLGRVLLGQRKNPPAKGFWFVPGGRIQKNESMSNAFCRLARQELGVDSSLADSRFLGPYEHFYSDSVFRNHISTHYVALAYRVDTKIPYKLPEDQHSAFRWFEIDQLLESASVHPHTKAYFISKD